jgi:hypothetical protein
MVVAEKTFRRELFHGELPLSAEDERDPESARIICGEFSPSGKYGMILATLHGRAKLSAAKPDIAQFDGAV